MTPPALALPGWAKDLDTDSSDLEHQDATVCWLHNTLTAYVDGSGRVRSRRRLAIKLLKPAGVDEMLFEEWTSDFRELVNLKGWVLHPDGRDENLPKENIVDGSLSQAGTYTQLRTVAAGFADLKPGDVAIYECRVDAKGWIGSLLDFVVQVVHPVRFAAFEVELPEGWSFHEHIQGDGIVADEPRPSRGRKMVYTWSSRNLPYREREPLALPWSGASTISLSLYGANSDDVVQFPTWSDAARWHERMHALPEDLDASIQEQVDALILESTDARSRAEKIATFVQDEIRYVAVHLGKGGWIPRPPEETLATRFGDCKDKTALMRSMLHVAGLPSHAVLVSVTRPVFTRLPSLQFDHCIVGIPLDHTSLSPTPGATADGWLYFDPTDPATAFGSLRPALQGSHALVAAVEEQDLRPLPRQNPAHYEGRWFADLTLSADGSIRGAATLSSHDVRASDVRFIRRRLSREEQIERLADALAHTIPNVDVLEYATGDDADSTWVTFTFQAQAYAPASGPLHVVKVDPFEPAQAPRLRDEERRDPISFGRPVRDTKHLVWRFPEAWVVESEPLDQAVVSEAGVVRCDGAPLPSGYRYTTMVESTGEIIGPEHYGLAREYDSALARAASASLVLRRP